LIVSPELKLKLKSKPYDPKKSCWVPNKATHGYDEGLIESSDGDKVTVMILETKEVSLSIKDTYCSFTCPFKILQPIVVSFFGWDRERGVSWAQFSTLSLTVWIECTASALYRCSHF